MLPKRSKKVFLEELRENRVWDKMDCIGEVRFDRPCTTYLSMCGLQGYIVFADGELAALFSLIRGQGEKLVAEAVARGATWLTCYDNGYLVEFYTRCGFDVVTLEPNWDGEHLPKVARMAWRK
jgi:hypothetical protein